MSKLDMKALCEEVVPYTNKWMNIGISLEVSLTDVERINVDFQTEETRLVQIFDKWNRKLFPPFTWNTIVEVLKSPTVGELSLADKIQRKYIVEH